MFEDVLSAEERKYIYIFNSKSITILYLPYIENETKNTRKRLKNENKNSSVKNCRHEVVHNIHFPCLKPRKMLKDPLT